MLFILLEDTKMNISNLTIKEVSEKLDKKEISSVELTKEVFERVKEVEPKVKAFITLTEKEALEQANESDKHRRSSGLRSLIDGIPISIKDIICTAGVKTTAASRMLEDFVPSYDATVVERLKNAGAVIIGKNNCDAWAHGASTENSDFFPTHNPWDLERVPGGSSGGSAAAVATGMGFASIGTDTGGSIRQPAGFCGVTGLKPTYGRNSRYGLIAMASSLDCPGPITRTAEDVAIIEEIIAGHDIKDSTTVPNKKFQSKAISDKPYAISNLKIGIPKEYFSKGLDLKVEKSVMEAVRVLEKAGAKVKKISLPYTEYGVAVYYIIQPAEVSSNLARYDGIKFGFSIEKDLRSSGLDLSKELRTKNQELKTISDVYNYSRAQGFGDEAKRRIMLGTYVLSAGYYDAYYKKAMKVRTLVIRDFLEAFKEVDIIITPTSPTLPFKIGENSNNPLAMYLADVYTCPANIAGIPGISIPCGFVENSKSDLRQAQIALSSTPRSLRLEESQSKDETLNSKQTLSPKLKIQNKSTILNHKSEIVNLPIGLQILGPQFGEERILQVANYYQQLIDWHLRMPSI